MDGASRLQKIRHIDLPLLLPTAMILLILRAGSLLSVGFEKVLLLQNPLNLAGSEIISTYVYKVGMINFQYSYSTAIGLFNTLVKLDHLTVGQLVCETLYQDRIILERRRNCEIVSTCKKDQVRNPL